MPTMKPPKLPGTEKFKFSDKRYEELRQKSSANSESVPKTVFPSNSFVRGIASRSTCPSRPTSLNTCDSPSPFVRYDSIRKPFFPISTRMSARVLTLTHLPLDSFDLRHSNLSNKSSTKCVTNSRRMSIACDSRESSLITGSRMSLLSNSSGSHSSSSSAQPSPRPSLDRSLCPTKWIKSAHRLSTASQSSCETTSGSEMSESFWFTRK